MVGGLYSYSDNTLQIPVQSVDVLENVFHSLTVININQLVSQPARQ
jgi:hypothetical protein